jgi:hypothetical protein
MHEVDKGGCVTRLMCGRKSKNSEKSTEFLCNRNGIIEIDHIESHENKSVAFPAEIGAGEFLDSGHSLRNLSGDGVEGIRRETEFRAPRLEGR